MHSYSNIFFYVLEYSQSSQRLDLPVAYYSLDDLGLKEKITFSHKCNEKVFLKIKARASTRIVDYKEKVDQRGC